MGTVGPEVPVRMPDTIQAETGASPDCTKLSKSHDNRCYMSRHMPGASSRASINCSIRDWQRADSPPSGVTSFALHQRAWASKSLAAKHDSHLSVHCFESICRSTVEICGEPRQAIHPFRNGGTGVTKTGEAWRISTTTARSACAESG